MRWLVGTVLVAGLWYFASARAQDPLRPGFPPCVGGERGYWQTARTVTAEGKQYTYLALTSQDLLDPAYVICWVEPDQHITVQPLPVRARPNI